MGYNYKAHRILLVTLITGISIPALADGPTAVNGGLGSLNSGLLSQASQPDATAPSPKAPQAQLAVRTDTRAQAETLQGQITTVYERNGQAIHFFLEPKAPRQTASNQRQVGQQVYAVAAQLQPLSGLSHLGTLSRQEDGTKKLTIKGQATGEARTSPQVIIVIKSATQGEQPARLTITPQDRKELLARARLLRGDQSLPPQLLSRLDLLLSR